MTDFRMTLKAEASDIAFAEERRAGELKRRVAALHEEIAKVQAELDQAEKASARIGAYSPMIGPVSRLLDQAIGTITIGAKEQRLRG
jgi:uncharacterized small protein (DUF1192 family)